MNLIKINKLDNQILNMMSCLIVALPFFFFSGPAIPDIIVSLSAVFYLYLIIKYNQLSQLKDRWFQLFLIFWIFGIISTLSGDYPKNIGNIIVYIRFIFFLLIFKYFLSKNEIILKYIFPILLSSIVLASVDGIIQSYFGIDLIGHKLEERGQYRLNGFFEQGEHILGFYIGSYVYFVLGYVLILEINKNLKNFLAFLIFLLSLFLIFISGERMALILFLFGFSIFIFLNLKNIKIIFILIISIFIIGISLFQLDNSKFGRFFTIFNVVGIGLDKDINDKRFRDSHYGAHYLTAFEMFKKKKIFGNGVRSFRYECSNESYSNIDSELAHIRCATHPHNLYLQLLSETGLVGLLFFIIFIFVLFRDLVLKNFQKSYLFQGGLIGLILFFWPIKSSNDIFNNRYALFFYFSIVLLLIINEKLKIKKTNKYLS